jgi:hypothetical protein
MDELSHHLLDKDDMQELFLPIIMLVLPPTLTVQENSNEYGWSIIMLHLWHVSTFDSYWYHDAKVAI